MTALEQARKYFNRGWQPLPLPSGSKNPNFSGWQNFKCTEADLPNYFNGKPQNISILLGKVSNHLTDIDIDRREALRIAHFFLPKTGAIFGRAEKPASHWLYYCENAGYEKFNDPFLIVSEKVEDRKNACIVEIRGKSGLQTVFPGSIHESGQPIEWKMEGEPAGVSAKELRRAAAMLASASLIAKFWRQGLRQDLTLALSGALLKNGFTEGQTENFIQAVCFAASDEEVSARMKGVRATVGKQKNRENVFGFPKLAELTDKKLVKTVCKWLQIDSRERVNYEPHGAAPQADHYAEQGEPIALPEKNLAVPHLDERLLPEAWREWLTDTAERLQCPLDYPTVSALIAASVLIGNRIRIRPKKYDSWLVVPNLWGAIVGVPGVMKTPAANEGLVFLREIAEKERLRFESALETADFEKEFSEAKKAELAKEMRKANLVQKQDLREKYNALKVEEPKEKRLWTTDVTVEKLGELLNENPDGLGIIRDELTGWFRMLDRSGHEQDRAFYLEAWNGEGSFTFDRIGRGKIHIKNLTVSILGTIQPSMLEPYLRGSLDGNGDDGLIQRFQILVYPETPKSYQYIDRAPKGREKARETFKRLYALTPQEAGTKQLTDEAGGYFFLQFDDGAQGFFQEWLTELETALRSGTFATSALESHLAKYRSLMPTLALIFHFLDYASGEQASTDISLKNAQMAAAWCSYLQAHAERIYQSVSLSEFDIAREILGKIQSKALNGEFTAKDIYGKHWAKLSNPRDVQSGLEILVEYGYLTPVVINEGHRPKTVYMIHEGLK